MPSRTPWGETRNVAALDLSGRHALVLGGGQGIGRASALALAGAGAAVAVLDVEAERAAAVAAEVEALGVASAALQADVTRAEEAEQAVAKARSGLGGLDIVESLPVSQAGAQDVQCVAKLVSLAQMWKAREGRNS